MSVCWVCCWCPSAVWRSVGEDWGFMCLCVQESHKCRTNRERTRTVSAAIIFSEERLTAALFPRHGWSIDTRSVSNNNSAARLNREETESPADGSPQINHVSHLGSQECLIVFKLAKSEIWTQIFLVKWSELLYTFILQLYTHTVQINFVCLYFSCCI